MSSEDNGNTFSSGLKKSLTNMFDLFCTANRILFELPFINDGNEELKKDLEWRHELSKNPCDLSEKEVSQLITYSKELYESKLERYRVVDKKAEWLFAIGMAVTGAIFYQISTGTFSLRYSWPVPISSLWALAYILKSRSPMRVGEPISPKMYCDFKTYGIKNGLPQGKETSLEKLMLISSFNAACAVLDHAINKKSILLRSAAGMLVLATLLSVIPLVHKASKDDSHKPKVHLEFRSF